MKKCRFCGHEQKNYMESDKYGLWYCRNERACFNRLLAIIRNLRGAIKHMKLVGLQMSNACFNLSQQDGYMLTPQTTEPLRRLRNEWDAAMQIHKDVIQ